MAGGTRRGKLGCITVWAQGCPWPTGPNGRPRATALQGISASPGQGGTAPARAFQTALQTRSWPPTALGTKAKILIPFLQFNVLSSEVQLVHHAVHIFFHKLSCLKWLVWCLSFHNVVNCEHKISADKSSPLLLLSTQQIFPEYLLCSRYRSGGWGYNNQQQQQQQHTHTHTHTNLLENYKEAVLILLGSILRTNAVTLLN